MYVCVKGTILLDSLHFFGSADPSTRPKKKIIQHTDISNLKRFEQIELQAKLLNYFLGSNKSNINQTECIALKKLRASSQ